MATCKNCGRGYEHDDLPFVCEVCGAENHEDGSWSYDGSREAVEDMEGRMREYDDAEWCRHGR